MSKLACIGSGNMGYALMKGACAKEISIFFTDADFEKACAASDSLGLLSDKVHSQAVKSNIEAVEKGDYIFLAVKPQIMSQVLAEIAPAVQKKISSGTFTAIVSMAAGWSIEKIQNSFGAKFPVIRIMPNTPSLIAKGMIALASSPEVPADKLDEIKDILSGAGIVDQLDERYIDAATGLSGSGPAFVYLFIEALADGGVKAGLPRDKALCYAAQTVMGAAAMVQETGQHPGSLKDMVTSPGGTTIEGIAALENGAFRGTVMEAVEAAYKRAAELG